MAEAVAAVREKYCCTFLVPECVNFWYFPLLDEAALRQRTDAVCLWLLIITNKEGQKFFLTRWRRWYSSESSVVKCTAGVLQKVVAPKTWSETGPFLNVHLKCLNTIRTDWVVVLSVVHCQWSGVRNWGRLDQKVSCSRWQHVPVQMSLPAASSELLHVKSIACLTLPRDGARSPLKPTPSFQIDRQNFYFQVIWQKRKRKSSFFSSKSKPRLVLMLFLFLLFWTFGSDSLGGELLSWPSPWWKYN